MIFGVVPCYELFRGLGFGEWVHLEASRISGCCRSMLGYCLFLMTRLGKREGSFRVGTGWRSGESGIEWRGRSLGWRDRL